MIVRLSKTIPELPNNLKWFDFSGCTSLIFGPEMVIQVGLDIVNTNYQKWCQKKCSEMYNPVYGKLFEDLIKAFSS